MHDFRNFARTVEHQSADAVPSRSVWPCAHLCVSGSVDWKTSVSFSVVLRTFTCSLMAQWLYDRWLFVPNNPTRIFSAERQSKKPTASIPMPRGSIRGKQPDYTRNRVDVACPSFPPCRLSPPLSFRRSQYGPLFGFQCREDGKRNPLEVIGINAVFGPDYK